MLQWNTSLTICLYFFQCQCHTKRHPLITIRNSKVVMYQLSSLIRTWWRPICDEFSMHTLTSPSPLGTTLKGEIHPAAPSGSSSIMSSSKSLLSLWSTCLHNPNCILHTGWATGFMDSLIWSSSFYPFKRLTPVNKSLYFSRIQLCSPPLSVLFDWKGPMCKRLRIFAVHDPATCTTHLTTTKLISSAFHLQ